MDGMESVAEVSATAVSVVVAGISFAPGVPIDSFAISLLLFFVGATFVSITATDGEDKGEGKRFPFGVGRGIRGLLPGVLVAAELMVRLPRMGVLDRDLRGVGSLNLDRVGRVVDLVVLDGGGPLSFRCTRGGDGEAEGGNFAAATTAPGDAFVWLLVRGVSTVAFPGETGGVTLCKGGVDDFMAAESSPLLLSIVSRSFAASRGGLFDCTGVGGGCENNASSCGGGLGVGGGFPNTEGATTALVSGVGGGSENKVAPCGGGLGVGGGFPNFGGATAALVSGVGGGCENNAASCGGGLGVGGGFPNTGGATSRVLVSGVGGGCENNTSCGGGLGVGGAAASLCAAAGGGKKALGDDGGGKKGAPTDRNCSMGGGWKAEGDERSGPNPPVGVATSGGFETTIVGVGGLSKTVGGIGGVGVGGRSKIDAVVAGGNNGGVGVGGRSKTKAAVVSETSFMSTSVMPSSSSSNSSSMEANCSIGAGAAGGGGANWGFGLDCSGGAG